MTSVTFNPLVPPPLIHTFPIIIHAARRFSTRTRMYVHLPPSGSRAKQLDDFRAWFLLGPCSFVTKALQKGKREKRYAWWRSARTDHQWRCAASRKDDWMEFVQVWNGEVKSCEVGLRYVWHVCVVRYDWLPVFVHACRGLWCGLLWLRWYRTVFAVVEAAALYAHSPKSWKSLLSKLHEKQMKSVLALHNIHISTTGRLARSSRCSSYHPYLA